MWINYSINASIVRLTSTLTAILILSLSGTAAVAGSSQATRAPYPQSVATSVDQEFASLPSEVRIPYKTYESGQIEIDIVYDGAKMTVWLDTGIYANFGLSQLRRAGLAEPGPIPDGKTTGWNGIPLRVWHVTAQIKAANLIRRIPIELEDDGSSTEMTRGMIGMAFLKGYSYEIDPRRHEVILRKVLPTNLPIDASEDVPLLDEYGIDNIMVDMNGHKVRCRFSTNLPNTTINEKVAAEIEAKKRPEKLEWQGIGGAAAFQTAATDIRFGPIRLKNHLVHVAGEGPCSIGQDVLKNCHYVIDKSKNMMRFFR